MEVVGIFYRQYVYFTAIWYILLPFGLCILWPFGIFFRFGMLYDE
jgi:hypothetical protein